MHQAWLWGGGADFSPLLKYWRGARPLWFLLHWSSNYYIWACSVWWVPHASWRKVAALSYPWSLPLLKDKSRVIILCDICEGPGYGGKLLPLNIVSVVGLNHTPFVMHGMCKTWCSVRSAANAAVIRLLLWSILAIVLSSIIACQEYTTRSTNHGVRHILYCML